MEGSVSRKYKQRDWLYKKYVEERLSASCIAEECDVSSTTIFNYLKKYNINIEKQKLHHNRDWLYGKYIEENLSMKEIAEIVGVDGTTIRLCLKKFGIKKENSKVTESREKTMLKVYGVKNAASSKEIVNRANKTKLEKYGTIHPSKLDSVKNKMKQTSIDRYGVETYLNTEHARSSLRKKNIINNTEYDIFGKSADYWAKAYDVPKFFVIKLYNNDKKVSKKCFIDSLQQYETSHTTIENIIVEKLNIKLYNKTFDLKKYPELRYKPDFKLSETTALNVDGLYWHSEKCKDKRYHFDLRRDFEDLGFRIYQFRADEVYGKIDIIKSMVNYKLNNIENRVYSRKTSVEYIDQKSASKFLKENHIMGSIKAKHIGLIYNNELVSIFSYRNFSGSINIDRFCSKTNTVVVGSFGKLLKKLTQSNDGWKNIKFWVDLRYGTGDFLTNFGFSKEHDVLSWKWTDSENTYNRLYCRANMDDRRLSEKEYAKELGLYKIYDAGQRLYILYNGEKR